MKIKKFNESIDTFKPLPKNGIFDVYYRIFLEGPGTKLENFNKCLDKLGTSINYNVSIKEEFYIYNETDDTSHDEFIDILNNLFKKTGMIYLIVWYDLDFKYSFDFSSRKTDEDFPGSDYYGDIYVDEYAVNVVKYNL